MVTDDHFHPGSLAEFTTALASAGFQLVADSVPHRWRGTIHPAFGSLTDAETMDIVIAPGWPFQPPAVFVQGLNTNHSTLDGLVCMWQDGDFSHDWTTVEGLFSRIQEWCEKAKCGWEDDHLEQDAFLNFRTKYALVATFDLAAIGVGEGSWGEFNGVVNRDPLRVDVGQRRRQSATQLRGMWFHVGPLTAPPPRELAEVSLCLPRPQRRGLQRALMERRRPEALVPSGGVDLILFCWERHRRTDLLIMACKGQGDQLEAFAMRPGPNDEHSLVLRAGPDAPILHTRKAVLFGAGALGGHTATLLAESGVKFLDIVDLDVLLPGNVVRHVAGHDQVGASKVQAVSAVVKDHAPWTEVNGFQESPRTPSQVRERVGDADIVIDTTGSEALTLSLALTTKDMEKPLVSGALYRGGSIGRVQRQALPGDTPINQRGNLTHYPAIPPGDHSEELAAPQLGCSAPVNNAPPTAVAACASLITQAAIDILTERFDLADEVLDVYRAIPDHPFDHVGRIDLGHNQRV